MVEFAKEMKKGTPVILPIGAMEEHGRHLPLATDTYQPLKIADMVAERIGGIVAPPVHYGNCSTTRNFPGTISVDTEPLRHYVREILMEFGRHGASTVVVLSGHAGGSHMAALKEAGKDFVEKYDTKLMVLSDYDIAYRLKGELKIPDKDGHGGMIETSRVMAIRPDLVKEEKKDEIPDFPPFRVLKHPEEHFPSGIMGYPTRSNRELGEKLNEAIAGELAKIIENMLEE